MRKFCVYKKVKEQDIRTDRRRWLNTRRCADMMSRVKNRENQMTEI